MSRITDLAAILSVLSKVAAKNAALRKAANEQKWKTSSILRGVGNERQTHDTFYTASADTRDSTEGAAIHQTASETNRASKAPDQEQIQETQTVHAARDPLETDAIDFTEQSSIQEVKQDASEHTDSPDDDLLMLRQARRISKLVPLNKQTKSDRVRKFRDNPETFRPSQADLYDVRSLGDQLQLRKEQAKWKPQTAIETQLSKPKQQDDYVTQKRVDEVQTQVLESSTAAGNAGSLPAQRINHEGNSTSSESHIPIRQMSSSSVPSSRVSRVYNYGKLGMSLGFNAFTDSAKRILNGPSSTTGRGFLSDKNITLLVKTLSRMRGAALKLGQMISFQVEDLPPEIQEILQRVQDSADYMPATQLNKVMSSEFGTEWRDLFAEFQDVPIAAASIGQVHKARLHDGRSVAVKVQYPGVARSISSDLRNASLLLTASRMLPKGLYLDKTIENARTELAWECDYVREADNTRKFRSLVGQDEVFTIPQVIDECSGKQVLTTEFLDGVGIAKSQSYPQELRDFLGTQIMRLCLRELAEFRFMQTDPNWTNFLYNKKTNKIELLDFGACRSFDDQFISKYCELLVAAARGDRDKLKDLSMDLGYLTGSESSAMVNAHISSILALSEPFSFSNEAEIYNFENQTITDRVKSFIPVMLRERLAPPPEETYSLHRRLSGHFMLCARLKSRIPCKTIFVEVMTKAGYMTVSKTHSSRSMSTKNVKGAIDPPDLSTWVERTRLASEKDTIWQEDSPMRQAFGSLSIHEAPLQTQLDLLDASLHGFLPSRLVSRDLGLLPGDHFVFWNDWTQEAPASGQLTADLQERGRSLQSDGYHGRQAPPDTLWRHRLWASGAISFHEGLLLDCDTVCEEHVSDIVLSDDGQSCKIATQRNIIQDTVKLVEERTLIYTNRDYRTISSKSSQKPWGALLHEFTPTSTLLFRYAALTSNAHRIHYDTFYAQRTEHYPDLLVQGSLLVTIVLRSLETCSMQTCRYSMISPCFVDETLEIRGIENNGSWRVKLFSKKTGVLKVILSIRA